MTLNLHPIRIGSYTLKGHVFLAPMAGVTDQPFRLLCKQLGAALASTEMVNVNSYLYGSEKTLRRASHQDEPSPVSVQIAGGRPEMMAEAARLNVEHGAQIIDINMGCPAKKICNTLAGSALLRDEVLVKDILQATVEAVSVPVTLKIRTGWDQQSRNGVRIAEIAQACGIQLLAVHGRTRCCMYQGDAEYETIAQIKRAISIPVIANGDIDSPQKAQAVLEMTGADGVMIGRAAQGRPWIFEEINHYLSTGTLLESPSAERIYALLHHHVLALYAFYGHDKGVAIARKHVGWYTKGQPGASHFRQHFNTLESAEAQQEAMAAFFLNRSAEVAA